MHSQSMHLLNFLSDNPDLLLAMVFGPTADGRQRPDSDIDVAVYPRKKLESRKRQLLVDEIAIATGRAVDLIDLTHVDGALLRQILRTGKVVFSKEPGILGTLAGRARGLRTAIECTAENPPATFHLTSRWIMTSS